MALAYELQERGDSDLATWIQRHVAVEQRTGKRRRGERRTRVRMARSGGTAWVPEHLVKEAESKGEEVRTNTHGQRLHSHDHQ
jgi:hypothetical protein